MSSASSDSDGLQSLRLGLFHGFGINGAYVALLFIPSLTNMLKIRLALAILFIRKINIRTSIRPIDSKGWLILFILPYHFEYEAVYMPPPCAPRSTEATRPRPWRFLYLGSAC